MMSLMDKLNMTFIRVMCKVDSFLHDEEGDTNFISILVLLGIALALGGVFLAFKDQIITWVDTNIGDFFSLGGGRT